MNHFKLATTNLLIVEMLCRDIEELVEKSKTPLCFVRIGTSNDFELQHNHAIRFEYKKNTNDQGLYLLKYHGLSAAAIHEDFVNEFVRGDEFCYFAPFAKSQEQITSAWDFELFSNFVSTVLGNEARFDTAPVELLGNYAPYMSYLGEGNLTENNIMSVNMIEEHLSIYAKADIGFGPTTKLTVSDNVIEEHPRMFNVLGDGTGDLHLQIRMYPDNPQANEMTILTAIAFETLVKDGLVAITPSVFSFKGVNYPRFASDLTLEVEGQELWEFVEERALALLEQVQTA